MKKTKKKIISMITSLLMSGAYSVSKAFEDYSFKEYSEDYQDFEEEEDNDDYDDEFFEEQDNLTKAYNWVLNHPYKFLGFMGLGYSTLKLTSGVYDAVKDNGQMDLQKYASNLIVNFLCDSETLQNLRYSRKFEILNQISEKLTSNMFRTALPCKTKLTSCLDRSTVLKIGIKDIIYLNLRCKDPTKLLSSLMNKWTLSKEWACYQCALVLKVIADQLGLQNCICKTKKDHVFLLVLRQNVVLDPKTKKEKISNQNKNKVFRYGGIENNYFGNLNGRGGELYKGLNKGDTIFVSSGNVYEILEKRWDPNDKKSTNQRCKEAYDEIHKIINSDNMSGETFLKKIDPKKNSYNNLLHNLCMYRK